METKNVSQNVGQVIPMHREGRLEKTMNRKTNVTTQNVGAALRNYIQTDNPQLSRQLNSFFYGHKDSKLREGCGLCTEIGGCELINMKNIYDMYWSNQYSRDEALGQVDITLGRHSQVIDAYEGKIRDQEYWASLNHRVKKVVGFP